MYRLTTYKGDKYAAEFVTDAMRRENITYRPAPMDKSELLLEFAGLLASGQVRLLEQVQLRRELASLERRRGSVRDRVDHPRGGHDDSAVAAALACVTAAKAPKITFGFHREEYFL